VNRYVVAGYIISIGSLFAYGIFVAARVRAARRRAAYVVATPVARSPLDETASGAAVVAERSDAPPDPS
jgi:hypothetical protein